MRLYQRDLRNEQLPFDPHLPASMKLFVVAFYVILGIGLSSLVAHTFQLWKTNQQAAALREEIIKANKQQDMIESVIDRFNQRKELVSDIQAWLQNRYDIEALYHQCANLVPSGLLLQRFSLKYLPDSSTLVFTIAVDGEPTDYNPYIRALNSHFTTTQGMKITNIQSEIQRGGALLSLEVLTNEERPLTTVTSQNTHASSNSNSTPRIR